MRGMARVYAERMRFLWRVLRHPYLTHLRLGFNVLLSPIYLWGVLLAGGGVSADFWLGYVALHVFLYGGTTAFNSYYDKDEGPIGGLLHPPEVDEGLLVFSLIVQALGLPLALITGGWFSVTWLLLFIIFAAYSHPRIRIKASPLAALTAIGLGQGALGFAAGWLVVTPEPQRLLTPSGVAGMLSTALIVTGLYIITQSYQTLEDKQRGDNTLPVILGPRNALLVAVSFMTLGGVTLLYETLHRYGLIWTLMLAGFFLGIATSIVLWAFSFDETAVTKNYYRAMRTATISSAGLSLFFLSQLL